MNYIKLGWRIRETRSRQKVSQTEVARELNFSQQHVGNVEKGYAHPSVDFLVEISNTLNVSLDYLLQDSLHRPYIAAKQEILSNIQIFLAKQKMEITELQKMLEDL
ncbi:MAG: helix-turn-helix domain-containing protein [Lachnospiraceae bacterium]|nr:helix-turn-helix domain-containing protein [Lachnospiraceae bacterium]MDE6625786.1 helix-turn-helix domain-containing protein [Lachnospiraceae bacterium]